MPNNRKGDVSPGRESEKRGPHGKTGRGDAFRDSERADQAERGDDRGERGETGEGGRTAVKIGAPSCDSAVALAVLAAVAPDVALRAHDRPRRAHVRAAGESRRKRQADEGQQGEAAGQGWPALVCRRGSGVRHREFLQLHI